MFIKKKSTSEYANVFWGNSKVDTPKSIGMACNWNWLKAQTGNTHPGSQIPYGWVTCLPYSGAYTSGYGVNACSFSGPGPEVFKRKYAWGVTHFHTSGTGYLKYFYNYFLESAYTENSDINTFSKLDNEFAQPGYYSGYLSDYKVKIELTCNTFAAFHKYTFDEDTTNNITLTVNQIGLKNPSMVSFYKEEITDYQISTVNKNTWNGFIIAHGVKIFFSYHIDNVADSQVEDFLIKAKITGKSTTSKIAFSLISQTEACNRLNEITKITFNEAKLLATNLWQELFDKVEISFTKEDDLELFYSTLYHSLIKPGNTINEYIDFQTMWDVYKTQLPLIMAIDPVVGKEIAQSMLSTIEKLGFFPISYMMTTYYSLESGQGSALVLFTLCDAYNRKLIQDYPRLKNAIQKELSHVNLEGKSPTHTLDYSCVCRACADIAKENKDLDFYNLLIEKSNLWQSVYNKETGLLVEDAIYYEGTHWNYSFRPHPDMAKRVAIAGGVEKFTSLLDKFFGIDTPQINKPEDRLIRENYFEGLNNETDMETPYCYLWAGRQDRLAEILDVIRRCRFSCGEYGCPGNNDSGALSSWFVWCQLGIYPLTGTKYYLLGSPGIKEGILSFGNGKLKIEVEKESQNSIYSARFIVNGKEQIEPWINIDTIENNCTIKFILQDKPVKSPIPNWL